MSDLYRMARNKINAILEKHRISDDILEAELFDAAMEIRSFQVGAPVDRRRNHKAVKAAESITRLTVPDIMLDEVIELVGDEPDFADMRRAYADWIRAGKPREGWTWLKWMDRNRKPATQGSNGQPLKVYR